MTCTSAKKNAIAAEPNPVKILDWSKGEYALGAPNREAARSGALEWRGLGTLNPFSQESRLQPLLARIRALMAGGGAAGGANLGALNQPNAGGSALGGGYQTGPYEDGSIPAGGLAPDPRTITAGNTLINKRIEPTIDPSVRNRVLQLLGVGG